MSPTPDGTLADPQQIIADLQRQLTESNAERDEALEQQTATAEVLGVINSSPGDLAPVFDAMLEKALRLCEGDLGTFWTSEGDSFQVAAMRGAPPEHAEFLMGQRHKPGSGTIHALLLSGEPLVHICEFDFAAFWVYDGSAFHPAARHHVPEPLWAYLQGHTPPAFAPIMSGEPLVHIVDVQETALMETEYGRDLTRLGPDTIRSLLIVPLRRENVLLGAISAYRQEVRPFTEKQIALLQNFAAQAEIAMENVRLITETREALEQQTATAEVLQVINSSPGDLAPVFDAMLEKAVRLCEAAFGVLWQFDGDLAYPAALYRVPEAFAEFWREPRRPTPDSGPGRIMRGEGAFAIADLREIPSYQAGDPMVRAIVESGGARSVVIAPLHKDDTTIGAMTVYRQEVRPFTDKQIALLQNFAAQAEIAMENVRLITETREALEQQTATAEVLQVINSSPGDLAPVFDAMLEKTMRLCDSRFGHIVTSADGEIFTVAAAQGPPAIVEFLRNRPPTRPGSGTSMERLVRGERSVHIHDAMAEEAYRRGDPTRRAVVDLGGCRTSVSVGLRKDDAMVGAITVYRSEVKPFSTTEIALIENFAAQAVIAMENARLLGELRQRTDEVGELNRDLEARVAEQVDELGRVGRLKRFLAPQLAELIVSHGDEKILESHRREIVVVFCDLRGYTAFTETAEPEEVLDFLRQYHGALGPLVSQFEGTLDQFSGDGIMVFFNDPVPCPDPAERAVKMAMAMREVARELISAWSRHGCELGFGIGIAQGYATLGQIGFSERSGYTAIGTVCNLAARLCAEAQDGQILVSSRVAGAVGALARLEDLGNLELKGLRRPVAAFNVAQSTSPAEARPNLTVVSSAPGA
jgi:class 3 adenylate cyclase/prephenate dehydratase